MSLVDSRRVLVEGVAADDVDDDWERRECEWHERLTEEMCFAERQRQVDKLCEAMEAAIRKVDTLFVSI
ncbi:hypothetical protein DPMN_129364 [Dreissena polymorpha]|uniref:Uncharacterized protein n=1 Tax=Dreissena polymorpha TaxID=45954 RepID=A0A9D4H306_DREPO|nr:hypothetical protein DPMN_129364 [Dreissena polymorpha]